ncbi:VC2046/SO_2500 family protein [Thalassotalea sp. G2M2-11]|uniref:VC2046/SO_2500 family protein n=1 Tax=Thalassotalea sp. G2M2-11 TaxID=2787627 RepID=UPI0019CFEB81
MLNTLHADILVEELQLGDKLNSCVHQNRHSDFSLMLAMLTDDVRAHSQFHLPETVDKKPLIDSELLRKRFDLPPEQRLALTNLEEISEYAQASLVENKQLTAMHLQQAMHPKPLAFRDDKAHINHSVMSNTSLYCQKKHQQKTADNTKHLDFNVNEWLKAVQTTIVKSPLINVAA